MQIDQAKIEKAIVEEAVHGFMGDDDLYQRIKTGIDTRIDKIFADRVSPLITDTVESIVKGGFERTYQKVDSFGRPQGQPTSISKEIERLVTNYWDQRVDRNGKPTENGAYNSTSRAEWMMITICADDFSKEMKQHVVNVAGSLKDHFRGVLTEHIGTMLSDVFHVNTAGDKALRNQGGSAIIRPPAGPVGA